MSTRPVLLDTDVASLLIKGRLPITLGSKLIGSELILPFVTWAELVATMNVKDFDDFRVHHGLSIVTA
ncbi:hypothetical protein Q0Z83_102550 [Actinoplanes sichuanensis]|uniref:PIN domain-containing protein n=1 Tax=Actinoplanes sichuanensis TaxID=512349 RepID=A0ABW4AIU0_9ACTN|nr:hypothetical protein [Actinoplanes sichuanensis]BEL12064.1 hypothetical protein Q0Z83_102550 [Actinoplanes sichuanensis]